MFLLLIIIFIYRKPVNIKFALAMTCCMARHSPAYADEERTILLRKEKSKTTDTANAISIALHLKDDSRSALGAAPKLSAGVSAFAFGGSHIRCIFGLPALVICILP